MPPIRAAFLTDRAGAREILFMRRRDHPEENRTIQV
jgi:hypothetical protein